MVIALNADGYVLSSSKPVYAATKGGKKGLIKAVTKGTCRIYVYAQDGTARTIKVQVR